MVGNAGWVSVGTLRVVPSRSVLRQQGAPLPAPTKVANGRPDRWRWLQLAAGPRQGSLTASDLPRWWGNDPGPTTTGPCGARR